MSHYLNKYFFNNSIYSHNHGRNFRNLNHPLDNFSYHNLINLFEIITSKPNLQSISTYIIQQN